MWRSKEKRCIADIKIRKTQEGIVDACVSCPRCPEATLIIRFSSASTKNSLNATRDTVSTLIEEKCKIAESLKATGKKFSINRNFHRKLPRRLP